MQPSAPEPVIKASYRAMMQKLNHHPDKGGDVGFAQLLNDAAKTLCDPGTRAQYDALRKQHTSASGTKSGKEPAHRSRDDTEKPPSGESARRAETPEAPKGEPSKSDDIYPEEENTALPPKPQCPFCLSFYPTDRGLTSTPVSYASSRRCRGCNGAKTPIENLPHASNQELRKMHRQHHQSDARFWLQWPGKASLTSTISDFSPAGCALIHPGIVAVGQTVMIETEIFNAICKVRHCKDSGNRRYLIGLEFITLDMLAVPGTLLSATA